MMHFDDFQIVVRPQNLRRLARQPEQRVDPGRKICGPDHRDFGFEFQHLVSLGVRMPRRADDHGLFVPRAQPRDVRRGRVGTEIHHHVALRHGGGQIVTHVNLRGDLQFAKIFRARNQRLAHPAFGSGNNYSCHILTQRRKGAETQERFFD